MSNAGNKNPGKHFSYTNKEKEFALDSRVYGAQTVEGDKIAKIGFRVPGGKNTIFQIVSTTDNPKHSSGYITAHVSTCGTLKQCLANTALNICGLLNDEYTEIVNATFRYSEESPVWNV